MRIEFKTKSGFGFYIDTTDLEYIRMPDCMVDRDCTGKFTPIYRDPPREKTWYDERIDTTRS